jgi:4-diphosphocytidyl-2-C-methyl-D-erythritol kinase
MKTLSLPAPAKLNLFLHVTGRRRDGYHELQTLFQLLDWGDRLYFTPNDSGRITLDFPDADVPDQSNLIMRAAQMLQPGGRGVHIAVDKQIPTGGGLGGGSSDAASTLLALNRLWSLGLSNAQLQAVGARLGADVPVFVGGHSAWAEGIGEALTAVALPTRWYFVLRPDTEVSTAEVFSHRELTRDSAAIKMAAFFAGASRNDCQDLVCRLYPEIDKALKWLNNFGDARLTGTGACLFAAFESEAQAQSVREQLPARWQGFVARGVNVSPALQALGLPAN